ncbi:MAG: oligosaccharide flippase family protein [Clostridia bacterium]|nr:oligosaccharide flippase family protein [Clostridia bacterium]
MNRYKKLFSDTGILAIGTFASKLLVFLLMPVYTAVLAPEAFSTAELITGTSNLLIPVVCLGITNGIFRFAAEKETDREAVFSSSLVLLFCGLLGFVALSPLLEFVTYLNSYVWLIVAYVFFANLQSVMAQYIRAIDRTKLFAVQGILNTALTILFNLLFLLVFKMGVVGYVLSVVAGNLVTTIFLFFFARLYKAFHWSKVKKTLLLELLRFSLPLVPTTVCWMITNLSDRYMVTYFSGAEANGIYSAAYKIPTIVTLLSGIFMQAWQFSAIAAEEDPAESKRFFNKVFSSFLALASICTGGLILLSGILTKLLLASSYHDAWYYMPTLLCAAAFEAAVSFLATVYLVKKKPSHSLVTALAGAILNVILNFVLIPRFGPLGAAFATMLAYGFVLILRMIDAPRMMGFSASPVQLLLCTILLFGEAWFMTTDIALKPLFAGILLIGIILVNLKPLFVIAREFFPKIKK